MFIVVYIIFKLQLNINLGHIFHKHNMFFEFIQSP
jgi:hypothetical protein